MIFDCTISVYEGNYDIQKKPARSYDQAGLGYCTISVYEGNYDSNKLILMLIKSKWIALFPFMKGITTRIRPSLLRMQQDYTDCTISVYEGNYDFTRLVWIQDKRNGTLHYFRLWRELRHCSEYLRNSETLRWIALFPFMKGITTIHS